MLEIKELSREVQLLYLMTNLSIYHGLKGNIMEFSDDIRERSMEMDICVLLAKAFCYEQIIEKMVESLYVQDEMWKRIKYKNVNLECKKYKEHYERIKSMYKLIDFEKVKSFKVCCDEFRIVRNKLAHELLSSKLNEVLERHQDIEEAYQKIYDLYMDQCFLFANRVAEKLSNPNEFLRKKADYSKDIAVIWQNACEILSKETLNDDDKENLANLHQLYLVLRDWKENQCTERGLLFKFEILTTGYYFYSDVKDWRFDIEFELFRRHLGEMESK